MKTEIILYDNHKIYLEALCSFLNEDEFNKKFVYKTTIEWDTIEDLITKDSSLLLMNITGLNVNDALELVEKFLARNNSLKIIITVANADVRTIKRFFDKGVKSFLTKNTTRTEFQNALNEILAERVYITEETKSALFNFICNVDDSQHTKSKGIEELTVREKDVLQKICEGLRTKEIAEKLFISIHTVESHRRNIMLKLDVHNSSMLVKFAMDHHLVT